LGIIIDSNPHHARLPRHARRLARRMARPTIFRHHASVLDAQTAALVHEVHGRDRGGAPSELPGESRISPGLRVRSGPEHYVLLRRLLAARNLREMQALAREIRHRVQKSIRAAERWRKLREKAAKRARAARTWFTGHAKSGWERALPQREAKGSRARGKAGAAPSRVTRTRAQFGTVPSRTTRGRFDRPVPERGRKTSRKRGRPAWRPSR
jgi:hypothetical protein